MPRHPLITATLWVVLALGCVPTQHGPVATVHVIAVDITGVHLSDANISSFQSVPGGKDFGQQFYDGSASGVPFGIYQLKVAAPGFCPSGQRVQVFQSDVWTIVGLDLGQENCSAAVTQIVGRVVKFDRVEKPTFVRLSGLYVSTSLDAKIDSESGDFQMTGNLGNAPYVLTVIGKTRVLDTRILNLSPTHPIVIDLSEHTGSPVVSPHD
jgi:hypothetical protein